MMSSAAGHRRASVIVGLSAGGMLTYHVAAINPKVTGIVGMAFLDQRDQRVRDGTAAGRWTYDRRASSRKLA
jgi:pimeloyl-ACP methyl ester carboxylesterase